MHQQTQPVDFFSVKLMELSPHHLSSSQRPLQRKAVAIPPDASGLSSRSSTSFRDLVNLVNRYTTVH